MSEAHLDHLRQMLAIHERATYTAKTADEKRAAERMVSRYAGWISDQMKAEKR